MAWPLPYAECTVALQTPSTLTCPGAGQVEVKRDAIPERR
jgi:hypothetical protein